MAGLNKTYLLSCGSARWDLSQINRQLLIKHTVAGQYVLQKEV